MEKRLLLRGFGAGALAGLLAFIFARIMAEPVIQAAINYESARDAENDKLLRAAGLAARPAGPDVFTRGIQRNVGIGIGLIAFGAAMGLLFTVAYIIIQRRTKTTMRPRVLAMCVAGAGFFAIYMVPYLKYPANPPSIGHPGTIRDRGILYVAMVLISIICTITAFVSARRMAPRFGLWNASLLAGVGFIVVIAVVMKVLPSLGHLHFDQTHYGPFSTETPQPLYSTPHGPSDVAGHGPIVFPGFPADILFKFRLYSIINQLILWTALGLGFGALAERMFAVKGEAAERTPLEGAGSVA
jgi:uncharacterized membrane protein YhhN